jgi:hypothetical protein
MHPALQRKHPARNKGADDIIRADVGLLLQRGHEAYHPVGFGMIRLRVIAPIGSTGRPHLERREINEICATIVLHVEESSLPGAARLEAGKLKERTPLAGANDAGAALHGRLGLRNFFALNGINPQRKEAGKRLTSGTNTDVGLHEGGVAGKVKDGIARKMVRLEFIEI